MTSAQRQVHIVPNSPKTALVKAYSYLRFSSPEQAKGASRRRQIEAAEKWASDNGLVLDEQLRDEGVSAFRGKHRHATSAPGGFLRRVDNGEVPPGSTLIVESFDRLSREEVVDALEQFLTLTRQGITVVTLADGRVYNRESLKQDQTQLIVSIIIMARAYEESATKSLRVGHAWRLKRDAARHSKQAMTATCPGWIRLVGGPKTGHYELIEERAKIVRSMFASVIAGEGRRTIVKQLNANRVELWGVGRNRGVHWHDSYVQKILASTASFGRLELRGERIEGYFPSVVSEDTYWKAKATSASRYFGSGRPLKRFNNLLHGLAKCHACGSTMAYVDKGKRSKPHLRCASAMASSGCLSTTVAPYANLEWLTIGLYARFKDAASFAMREDANKAAAELDPVEAKLVQARSRSANLAMAIADGGNIASITRLLETTEVEIAELEARLALLNARVAADTDMGDDLSSREDELYAHLLCEDEERRFKMRALFNARLRRYVERFVVNEVGDGYKIYFVGGLDPTDENVTEWEDPRTWEQFLEDEARQDEMSVNFDIEP